MRLIKNILLIFFLIIIYISLTSSSVESEKTELIDLSKIDYIKDIEIKQKETTSFITNIMNNFNNTVHSFKTREGVFAIFSRIGNFAPIAFFPEFSFRTSSPITIDVGLGGGYRDFTSRNIDKTIKDSYTYWFVGASFGVTYRDVMPNFSIGISHVSRFQKTDCINQGDPLIDKEQFPFYIGYFDLLFSYSKMDKYLYSKKGISSNFLVSFYINGFFSLRLTFDWASDPFVEIKNANNDVMFAINYINHERVLHYYNFKGHSRIPDVVRKDYMLGMKGVGGQTDRPFTFVSENSIMMQGPRLWLFRPFLKVFFEAGFTYGRHYQDTNNIAMEYLMSPGFDLGLNFYDFISLSFRATFPLPYFLEGNKRTFYHLEAIVEI